MGNFSRTTFDALKHYVGVRLQQGVPIVDADWNELEDIRKYELQAFLKWFAGNGVPKDNDGFHILAVEEANDFSIAAGRCLVDGWDAINEKTLKYTEQPLYMDTTLATSWQVAPLSKLADLGAGTFTVCLDVWEREVNAQEDHDLNIPSTVIETCVRLKREWVVRVRRDDLPAGGDDDYLPGHSYYQLARLDRKAGATTLLPEDLTDLRRTFLSLAQLEDAYVRRDGDAMTGPLEVKAKLQVTGGAIMPATGTSEQTGIVFRADPEESSSDEGWIRCSKHDSQSTLELGASVGGENNSQPLVTLMSSGRVGIGMNRYDIGFAKLHIANREKDVHGCRIDSAAAADTGHPYEDARRAHLMLLGLAPKAEARLGFSSMVNNEQSAVTALIKAMVEGNGGDLVFQNSTEGHSKLVETMRIAHTGRVGIGRSDPRAVLDIVADKEKGDDGCWIQSDPPAADLWRAQLTLLGSALKGEARLGFRTMIDSVHAPVLAMIKAEVDEDGGALVFQNGISGLSKLTDTVRIARNGCVGIGIVEPEQLRPEYKLNVKGDVKVQGNLYANNFPSPSDVRLKTDIRPLSGALNGLEHIRGVSFIWRDEAKATSDRREIGVIAQEVEQVFPELVTEGSDGMKAVNYDRMVAVLVEAVKELKAQNEALHARLNELEQWVASGL